MGSLLIGFLLIAFTTFAALPQEYFGLNWGQDILLVLRGGAPVFAAFLGLIAIFIGIADIKDRQDAKKEKAAMEENN